MADRRRTAGLGTRVALRTFVLFCFCAAVPVLGFGLYSYRYVEKLVRTQTADRLQEVSKRYALLLNERLAQADSVLLDRAQVLLSDPSTSLAGFDTQSSRVRVVSARTLVAPAIDPRGARADATPAATSDKALPASLHLWRSMQVTPDGAGMRVLLTARLASGTTEAEVVGEIQPNYLWDSDSVALQAGRICVRGSGAAAYCSGPPPRVDSLETARWQLYLKPRYGADAWEIVVEQDSDVALAALKSFKATLPLGIAITLAVALLLSSVQIRRSHRPLVLLTEAVRRLSRGDLKKPLHISSRDEFGNLSRAFNVMAGNIRRQFAVISTLAGIDRQILALPAVEPIIRSVLPQMLKVLSCDSAAVLLRGESSAQGTLFICRRATLETVEMRSLSADFGALDLLGVCENKPVSATEAAGFGLEPEPGGAMSWRLATIGVGGSIRGAVFVGHSAQAGRRMRLGQLGGLARRIAVAVGNEDRERALLRQAYYDGLTGLPNRQLFRDRLEQELLRAAHSSTCVALLFIDLDHFKTVNDSLGHTAGDKLLEGAAQRLRNVVPEGATLARLGGDEFTIVMPAPTMPAIAQFANEIHVALLPPCFVDGALVPVQASVGIAIFPQDGSTAEDLLRNADTAMYRAKAEGRGRSIFFEESMNVRARRRFHLAQRLRAALDRDGLHLVFQPKIDARSGGLAGVETLARWQDPEEGAISPAEFIPLAEECGLIERIGDWSIRHSCAAMEYWRLAGIEIPHVAVNVSMHQLKDTRFVANVVEAMRAYSIRPGELELEITESSIATNMEAAVGLLDSLRSIGARIAIDDFGTGYSSMTSLAKLPADVVKIDRSFVMNCTHDTTAAALLRGMIGMAHALGKQVVAEGVETEAQAAFLRAERCDHLQGFLFAKGLSRAGIAEFAVARAEQKGVAQAS